ncbi:hypothetical protein, partial [Enterococcus faecalis]|uniref:hypothetical protein n=1 Tax=Enterococcus faecalis TaxID=1351 RepID=UPI001C264571
NSFFNNLFYVVRSDITFNIVAFSFKNKLQDFMIQLCFSFSEFKLITATTDYEYRNHIMSDLAFDRRFMKIILSEPNQNEVL